MCNFIMDTYITDVEAVGTFTWVTQFNFLKELDIIPSLQKYWKKNIEPSLSALGAMDDVKQACKAPRAAN